MAKHTHSDEKLMTAYYKAVDFFEQNKKHVYTALTVLVIAVAGIILLVNRNKANNENAGVAINLIKRSYDNNEFQQAISGDTLGNIKGLQYIVEEYGSTENGQLAKLMLANCYYNLRDFDKAEKYYKDYSGSNSILKASALAGEATVSEARQKYSDAAKQFEKAATVDTQNPFSDQYLFYSAKNYVKAGENEKAKNLFDKIKKDHPKSKYVAESEKYRSIMNSAN
jgi:tetratricopeptide (TPR) repeat protein